MAKGPRLSTLSRVAAPARGVAQRFGLVLLIPRLNERFATATAGFAATADARLHAMGSSGDSTGTDTGLR